MKQPPLLILTSGQVASLAFLLHDICLTFDDEVDVIWSRPNHSWIKWQFLFIRYFALAAQIANRSIELSIISGRNTLFVHLKDWYISQVVVDSAILTAVEIVLMARVFALYNKNIGLGLAFVVIILGELATVVTGIVMTIPSTANFRADSFLVESPRSFTYFGIGAMVSQVVVLALTLIKYKSALRAGWGKIPIMLLMVRDGTMTFFLILLITTLTVFATLVEDQYSNLGNSWFISIVSSAGCRSIINMQRLPSKLNVGASTFPNTAILTTRQYLEYETLSYSYNT